MARTSSILRVAATIVLAAALSACSSAPAASPAATVSPTAIAVIGSTTPEPPASPSTAAIETAAPTDAPDPSRSAKPVPSIDQATLDAMLTSSITLLNLADADLSVVVLYREAAGDTPFPLGSYTLAFTEQQTYEVPAGVYDLAFRQAADSTTGPSCTIELTDADAYTFAAIDGAVAIARAGQPPTEADELFVDTSSLCIE